MEFIELGSAPSDENCVQVKTGEHYEQEMIASAHNDFMRLANVVRN